MKSILFAVLIGSIIATAYSAPAPSKLKNLQSQLQALMQDADDDDVAERALLESDDSNEERDEEVARLVDAIVTRIIQVAEEKKREEEEDEGTGDECNGGEGGEGSEGGEGGEGSEGEDDAINDNIMDCIYKRVEEMREEGDATKPELAKSILKCIDVTVDELRRAQDGEKANAQIIPLLLGTAVSRLLG